VLSSLILSECSYFTVEGCEGSRGTLADVSSGRAAILVIVVEFLPNLENNELLK
jgi:hypothetical protein